MSAAIAPMTKGDRETATVQRAPTNVPARFKWEATEKDRTTLFPIRNPKIWAFRKTLEKLHWVVEDVDMSKDANDWKTRLDARDKHFIKYTLGLFAVFDNLVIKNLKENFAKRFNCMEAEGYLAIQEDQEWVHAEGYMLQAEGVVGGEELKEVLGSIRTMPAVKAIIEWAKKYLSDAIPDGEALIAWAFVEGVIFSGAFAGIQWLRERNMLPGMTEFNQFIARDEGVHCLFTCHVAVEQLIVRAPRSKAHEIAAEAIAVASMFVDEALPQPLYNMSAELMKQYVQFQADCVLAEMKYKPLYGIKNPFTYMDKLSLNEIAKANFFERSVTAYQGPSEGGLVFGIDETEVKY
jgi:ribonucleoside-diphosphate reductase beta chain